MRQDRRLVARARANFENRVAAVQLQPVGHESDDEGLRDRLTAGDRQRLVGVGLIGERILDKQLPRNRFNCRKHALILHALIPQRREQTGFSRVSRHGAPSTARTASMASTWVKFMCSGVTEIRLLKAAHKSVPTGGLPRSRLKPSQ